MTIFVVPQAAPSEAAPTPKPDKGFKIDNMKGSLPGGGTFTGSILIEKFLPEGGSKQQIGVVGTILTGTATTAEGTIQTIANEPFSAPAKCSPAVDWSGRR